MSLTKSITFSNCYTVLNGQFSALSVSAGTLTRDITFNQVRVYPIFDGLYRVEYEVTVDNYLTKGVFSVDVTASTENEATTLAEESLNNI